MKDLQILCLAAKSEVQFQETTVLLLLVVNVSKCNAELDDGVSSVSSFSMSSNHDDNIMDLSELSGASALDDFLDENDNVFLPTTKKLHNMLSC